MSEVDGIILREACGATGSVLASLALAGPEGPSPMHLVFNEAQREKYLKPLINAETTCCFMLSEPGAGSDAQNITTLAEKKGDKWVLNGVKHFISNGHNADWGVAEHAQCCRDLEMAGGWDQLDMPNVSMVELVARRLQIIEFQYRERVRQSDKSAVFG